MKIYGFFILLLFSGSASAELFTGTRTYECSDALAAVTADFNQSLPTVAAHNCQLSENITPVCDTGFGSCSFSLVGVCDLNAGAPDSNPDPYDFDAHSTVGCASVLTNSCVANAHLTIPSAIVQGTGEYMSGACACNEGFHVDASACVPDDQEPPPDRVCNPETGDGCATADKQDYQSGKLDDIKNAIVSSDGTIVAKFDELIKAVQGLSFPDTDKDGDQDTDNSNDGDSNNDGQDDDKGAICEDANSDDKCDDSPSISVCADVDQDKQCDGLAGDSGFTGNVDDGSGDAAPYTPANPTFKNLSDKISDANASLDAKKAEFKIAYEQFKNGLVSAAGSFSAGGGSCPTFSFTTHITGAVTIDICQFSRVWDIIGGMVILMAAYASARILLGSKEE